MTTVRLLQVVKASPNLLISERRQFQKAGKVRRRLGQVFAIVTISIITNMVYCLLFVDGPVHINWIDVNFVLDACSDDLQYNA